MKFPRQTQDGGADARRRLDEARQHEREMQAALDAPKDGAQQPCAATELVAAVEKTAAREAWLAWADRDE
jgi:hypothetical protein